MTLWDRYRAALGAYQRNPTLATRRKLGFAYAGWIDSFCPDMAIQLAEEFADRLDKHFTGKAA